VTLIKLPMLETIKFEENISNVFNHWGREQNVGGSEGRPFPSQSCLSLGKIVFFLLTQEQNDTLASQAEFI